MNTNLEMFTYVEDEFMSPVPANNRLSPLEKDLLADELLSALRIKDNRDNNPVKEHAEFLAALALRFLTRF